MKKTYEKPIINTYSLNIEEVICAPSNVTTNGYQGFTNSGEEINWDWN